MKPLKILAVASEVVPFSKTGGLADVMGSLPAALKRAGHDVRVVTPRYYSIDRHQRGLRYLGSMAVAMGPLGVLSVKVLEGENDGVPVYFLDCERFYGRLGIYNDYNGQGYGDNDQRFALLSRAALVLCHHLDFTPDVIHVNDWQTSAIPVMLNTNFREDRRFANTATVLTIHNMQHQGICGRGVLDVLGVGDEVFHAGGVEYHGNVNLLKGGIYHSTLLNTVSEGYAREIRTPEYGYKLDGVIRDRGEDLRGIVNGIDEGVWNPSSDPVIASHYSADDLSGKAACKADLQRQFGLPVRADVPLIGLVSRLVYQKGVDVLAAAMPHILELDVQVAFLGSGEGWTHDYFPRLAHARPGKMGCFIGYSEPLAHKIEAGSDFFLMPSRFEPCGLNQLYSLRYGTLPIVRATGGLDDTVENFNEQTLSGTGFKFHDLTPGAIVDTVGWAVHTYYNRPDAMAALIQQAMAQSFSWERSARAYEQLFREAVARVRG